MKKLILMFVAIVAISFASSCKKTAAPANTGDSDTVAVDTVDTAAVDTAAADSAM